MREPRFWARDVDPRSREAAPLLRILLSPLSWLYAEVTRRRIANATPLKVRPIIICIGNLTAGGVGKSPIVEALREDLAQSTGLKPQKRKYVELSNTPERVQQVHRRMKPHYDHLYAHRITL